MNKYRIGTDVPFQLSVDDGVEYLDLSNCTILKVAMYCDAQEAFAGACTWQLNADDHTKLDCVYPGDRQVYTGVMRAVVVMVGADGGKKAYDLADIFEIVATTEEANATKDTVTSATLSAWQLPMSTLSTIVEAAINATEATMESAIAEISYTANADDDGINVLHIEQADGTSHDFDIKNGSRGPQGPEGPQGPQGIQGNTGSSVEYPFELVNNRTTDDATKALSAAEGKRLGDDISELDLKVDGLAQDVDSVVNKTTFTSPNLFDKSAGTPDKYVKKASGDLASSSNGAMASDYIPVPIDAESLYISEAAYTGAVGWAFYNSSKVFTHGGSNLKAVVENGDAYFRFTIGATRIDTEMLVVGNSSDLPQEYMPYGEITARSLEDDIVGTNSIKNNAITKEKIADSPLEPPYSFELGSMVNILSSSQPLDYLSSTTRVRFFIPFQKVAAVRIVKSGWRIVVWAAYKGGIPASEKCGEVPSGGTLAADVAGVVARSGLDWTPDNVVIVLAKDDDSDLSSLTSIDDIIQIDAIDKTLLNRDVVVLGDSSCDVITRNCWARVLQGWSSRMGVNGIFCGTGSTGWSTDITTPNVFQQWENNKSAIRNPRPIIIITTGGNELASLQLSYEDTLALCARTITTPANAQEWAVYTLREIIDDMPMARIYLVSNFYARSSAEQDARRLVYREMLRALCDYFSIELIDLTRNSEIRGFMENTSGSTGYHIYTPDGVHATTAPGRFLIFHKIVGYVINKEKYNV